MRGHPVKRAAHLHGSLDCDRRAAVALPLALAALVPAASSAADAFDRLAADAQRAFQRADYAACERLWREAAAARPTNGLAWANLAVILVINASDEMQLGVPAEGRAKERLEEALSACERADSLSSSRDAPAAVESTHVRHLPRRISSN